MEKRDDKVIKPLCKGLRVLWASPYSLAGIAIGMLGLMTGGHVQLRGGALEFFGGGTKWFVRHLPLGSSTLAITLGHIILGQDRIGLLDASYHERVHVRQFEVWGPLMGPAYLGSSMWMWWLGRDPYWDNPFEVQAYRETATALRENRSA